MEPGETKFIGGKEITYCEFRIIQQVMKGLLRKQVAAALGKSEDTIDCQMRVLFIKLEIKKINELIAWGYDKGFDSKGNYTLKVLIIPPVVPPPPPARKKKTKKKK